MSSLAEKVFGSTRDALLSTSWGPITVLAERAVLSTLSNFHAGQLRILKSDGSVLSLPAVPKTGPCAELRVVRDTFWVRLACMGGLGFAEAYMFGDVHCAPEDLRSVFKIFLLNRSDLDAIEGRISRALSAIANYLTTKNALGTASGKISAHYDISNRMFEGFLSSDMMYSSGLFEHLDADLHHAQLRKIQHILRRLKIRPGNRVLEVGTGWGSFAIIAAQEHPTCTFDTITLSSSQKELAEERIRRAGLDDRIHVHLLDYRALPSTWEGKFDRFVSIEMMEHVGHEYIETYFAVVHWALKQKDAVGVVQVSTMPESLFPGAFLPTVTQLLAGLHEGSRAQFIVDTIDNMGPHYPQTLREWARRFEGCFEEVIVPELRKQSPDMCDEDIEVFRRKWLCDYYCEAGFTSRTLGNHTVTFTREAMDSYGCNIHPPR
ncbi:cyclopropane-fatty-acyl-phospholipid synthase [Exidia glandulosa HHB12029]|uniref:Cyclopropane-fatty-acyl-phospholipid synthase n=1 Tax=Exidia glandulosa HHB12029 TaxID=1314781 RepID=A0A166B7L3_EXIGL|nr:cyclopropane-fatty-acyl-phospholipid synthase [Exidia glandulosa HHB12029]